MQRCFALFLLLGSVGAMPTGALSKRALSSTNDKLIYFAGSMDGALTDKTFGYDGSTWSEVGGTLNTPRYDACGVVLGSTVYLVGGWTATPLNTVETYDGTQWTLKSSTLNTARRLGSTGCTVFNGKIWAVGGAGPGGAGPAGDLATVEIYDPDEDTWSFGPELPAVRRGVGLAVHGGRLFVVGGWNEASGWLTSVLSIGATESTWTTEASLSHGRHYHSVTSFNGKIYAAGGVSLPAGAPRGSHAESATVESYDGTSWSIEPAMSTQRQRFGLVTAMDGDTCHLYALGWDSTSVERLGADSTAWEAHSTTPGVMVGFASVALGTSACPAGWFPGWTSASASLPGAQANGDPHLTLGHGGKADFRGSDRGLYNFLSAKNLSLNVMTEFADFKLRDVLVHGSFMTQAHVVAKSRAGRTVHASYWAEKIGQHNAGWMNGTVDDQPAFSMGAHGQRQIDDVMLSMDYSSLHVATSEWEVVITPQPVYGHVAGPAKRLDVQVKARVPEKMFAVPPHGIIGQSWDGDHVAVNGKQDVYPQAGEFTTSAMAEGAIEGVASDYLMPSRYATVFKYSHYGADQALPRKVAQLAGKHTMASLSDGAVASERA